MSHRASHRGWVAASLLVVGLGLLCDRARAQPPRPTPLPPKAPALELVFLPSQTVAPPAPIAADINSSPAPRAPESPAASAPESHAGAVESASDKNRPGIAGWFSEDGFAIKSADDEFTLRLGLQAGYRYEPNWRDGKAQSRQSLSTIRPIIAGNLFRPWVRFWTSLELSQSPPILLDTFLEIAPFRQAGVRLGQQYTPLSRHESVGPPEILFPDWASVASYFWTGRDKGLTLFGTVFAGKLNYWTGVFSGSPPGQFTSFSGSWIVVGRLTVNPMGPVATNETAYITPGKPPPFRVSFTLQGAAGDYRLGTESYNPSTFRFETLPTQQRSEHQTASADFWMQGPRFTLLIETYLRHTKMPEYSDYLSLGCWGQTGVMLWSQILDLGVRFNYLDSSDNLSRDAGYSLEGQLAYYPFQRRNLIFRLRYGFGHQQTPRANAPGPVSMLLPPGDSQLLTIQAFLAI